MATGSELRAQLLNGLPSDQPWYFDARRRRASDSPDTVLAVSYLSQAAGRIKRALRQEARLQVAECRERERLGFTEGFYPGSLQRLSDQFADEVYFTILATR